MRRKGDSDENPPGKKGYWPAVVMLGIGAVLVIWPIHTLDAVDSRTNHIQTVGVPTNAFVVDSRPAGADEDYGHLDIQFSTATGVVEEVSVPVDHRGSLGLGDQVKVQYDPNNPSNAIVVGNTANSAEQSMVPLFLIGCGLLIGGIVSVARTYRRRRRLGWEQPIEEPEGVDGRDVIPDS